jgi:YVTN family beta-propeller protein
MGFKKAVFAIWALSAALFVAAGWMPLSAQAQPFAYITNQGDDTVSVIDTATNRVTATIPVGDEPYGVAVHPDGRTVYVTNIGDLTVSVINAATNTVSDTIQVGGEIPYGVAVTPDGAKLYVANGYTGINVIDTATNTVIRTIPLDSLPSGIAVHPDGSTVYVADAEGPSYVIDTAKDEVIDTFEGGFTMSVAVNPDGSAVYMPNVLNHEVVVVDTLTNAVTHRIHVPEEPYYGEPYCVAVHPNGKILFVSGNSEFSVIDLTTNAVTATIPNRSMGLGLDVTPDGSRVFLANRDEDTVSVVDTATNKEIATIPVGFSPAAFGQFIGPAAAPSIEEILEFLAESVVNGTLEGIGRWAGIARLNLNNMRQLLENAQALIAQERLAQGRFVLYWAHLRCDGKDRPADIVKGDASAQLSEMILSLLREY